jgi:hypothetical protein
MRELDLKKTTSSPYEKQLAEWKWQNPSQKVGNLKLRVNKREDIFHAEDLPLFEFFPSYEDLIGIEKIGFAFGSFATDGTKIGKLSINLEPQNTIISGFLEDTTMKEGTAPYKVKIYITYETEE